MSRETMSSRERVLKAINHERTDRMPIDLGVHFSTGISAFAYWNLREYLGLSIDNIEMIDCVQCLARVDNDIIERFHIDTILLNPKWENTYFWNPRDQYSFRVPRTFNPVQYSDGSYHVSINDESMYMPANGYFFDGSWPDIYCMTPDEKLEAFAISAEKIYKETDKFTMLMGFSGFFHGLEFACDMLLEPEQCKQLNHAILKEQTEKFTKVNLRYGKYINAIEINSDLGTQNSLICSPSSYKEICYPYLKEFCRQIHETSDIKIFMHSCGAVAEALPLIIDAGIDVLNPVQISATGMDPETLKAKYGMQIAFWGGGCDTQNILWSKSSSDVIKHTKEMIDAFKSNSGYIFNQVHNIMGNVPPENIVAMLDCAYENCFYQE